jgi:hypothetical protein
VRPPARLGFALLVSVAVAAPASVHAQSIRGRVTDAVSGAAVGQGFVVLLSADGRELMRMLTTRDGRFEIPVPGAGSYRLRSERIGYRVWESAELSVSAREAYSLDPIVEPLPSLLESITITGETDCETRKGPDTGLLWEEARKALVAASWSAEQEMYWHRVHRFQRDLDESRSEVRREQIDVSVVRAELPFVSEDPAELAERGFVVPAENNELMWWAVDANVLLDPSFHRTHCFWAVDGEDEREGLMGLAFEPTPDRDVPDVEGTLWLDEQSGELQEVEFSYTNLPGRINDDHLGGRATFLPMPSGAWILNEWRILIPALSWRNRRRARIVGYRDAGGQVLEVYDRDGAMVYEVPGLVTVRGTVYDSIRGAPLASAVVSVAGTEYAVETDSAGGFAMRVLLEGRYRLTTSRHDWLGYTPGMVEADFIRGDTVDVRLTVPSLETVHRHLCPRAEPGRIVLHGTVRTPEGFVVPHAEVVARWEPGIERKVETDYAGRFVLCDLPDTTAMVVTVRHDRLRHNPVHVRFIDRDVLIETAADRTSYYVPERIVRLGLEVLREER